MGPTDILLFLSFAINLYIIVLTFEIIKNFKVTGMISDEKENQLYLTTLLLPVLGYYLVRKLEIREEY